MLPKIRESHEDRRRYYEPLYFSTGGSERRKKDVANMKPQRRKSYDDRRQYYEPLYFSNGGTERRKNRCDRRLEIQLENPNCSMD